MSVKRQKNRKAIPPAVMPMPTRQALAKEEARTLLDEVYASTEEIPIFSQNSELNGKIWEKRHAEYVERAKRARRARLERWRRPHPKKV